MHLNQPVGRGLLHRLLILENVAPPLLERHRKRPDAGLPVEAAALMRAPFPRCGHRR